MLMGCGRAADMMPLNDQARGAGIPRLDMTLYGTGHGPATVTMRNGEVLNGHYRLAVGGAVSTGFGIASGPRGITVLNGSSTAVPLQNPFNLQATGGQGTTTMCEGAAGGLGHGEAICTTNRGAQYQMMF